MKTDNKGFTCTQCKKYHPFDAYVYAHTNIELVHTCDCGKKHIIIECGAYPEDEYNDGLYI